MDLRVIRQDIVNEGSDVEKPNGELTPVHRFVLLRIIREVRLYLRLTVHRGHGSRREYSDQLFFVVRDGL